MNKLFVFQISLIVIFGSGFVGTIFYTDVYDYVQESIVSTVCLSCIKMDPAPSLKFTFETVDGRSHPDFVLDNLTKGPIFLAFRKDICDGCEIMDPLVQEIFNVNFGLEDYESYVSFEGTTIYFRHINVDRTREEFKDSFNVYGGAGVPMFVAITLSDNNGTVEPYYRLEYGTLGLKYDSDRKEFLRNMMRESIDYYN
ncbi:MAG: hypothetical protein JSW62_01145 [Thermoplasmatales archaeon]|nr:MAG: hypothetical protein JSW62_01145 [Thermoplasmatales archaeon]